MASEAALKREMNGMSSSKEDKRNRDEKLDRADREEPSLVPPDLDVDEGDEEKNEEKNEETKLPPAMPPKVEGTKALAPPRNPGQFPIHIID